jgi:hypothetical protein
MQDVSHLCEFYSGICLTPEGKHGKTSVRVRKTSVGLRKTLSHSTVFELPKHPHITKPSQPHTLQNPLVYTHTHTHTHYNTI